jgi:hypothetical protein
MIQFSFAAQFLWLLAPGLLFLASQHAALQAQESQSPKKIVLVAGETAKIDKMGHHDYLAGCKSLEILLKHTSGVEVIQVTEGWPEDEQIFNDADSIVFYTDGGGKQAFLSTPQRVAKMQSLVDAGVGLVMLHQAVDFPEEFGDQAMSWLGGVYLKGRSGRGHWDSKHVDFPEHPITRGVIPWEINDGWLNALAFVKGMQGITPLVWSGKEYLGSRAGLDDDIVGWAYERPSPSAGASTRGRSFSFTGLDAHEAWSRVGMRQMVVNGVLWTAGMEVPASGAPCEISPEHLSALQTPRQAPQK